MALFKRKVNITLPEQLEEALALAPAEAKYMKSSLIYSVEKGVTGVLFEGWRDENFSRVEPGERKPPFHMIVPTPVADYYFERVNGVMAFDLVRHGFAQAA